MFTVALIGPDGAGKTTMARRLVNTFPLPIRYLYMGVNIESSNVALPTSRLIEKIKQLRNKKSGAARSSGHVSQERKRKKSGVLASLRAGLRLVNRLSEEWYRQFLSWKYQRKGHIVVYDRHFQFDFERNKNGTKDNGFHLTDWLHRWCLANLYPRPDLVIYLDAPAEVLYARKREATLEYLESRRQAFLQQGKQIPNFVVIDSTQPLERVYSEVAARIMSFYESNHNKRSQRTDSSVSMFANSKTV
jgi:thymidylate kinase